MLGFDKADVFTSPMGRSEYEKYLYGEWNVQLRINGVLAYFLRSRRPLAGGYQTVEYHDNPGLRYGEGIDIVLDI